MLTVESPTLPGRGPHTISHPVATVLGHASNAQWTEARTRVESGLAQDMLGSLVNDGFRNGLVPTRVMLARLSEQFAPASNRPRAADVMRDWSTVSRLGGF